MNRRTRGLIVVLLIAAPLSVTVGIVWRGRTVPRPELGSAALPGQQDGSAAAPDRKAAGPSSMPADPETRLRAFFAAPLAQARV